MKLIASYHLIDNFDNNFEKHPIFWQFLRPNFRSRKRPLCHKKIFAVTNRDTGHVFYLQAFSSETNRLKTSVDYTKQFGLGKDYYSEIIKSVKKLKNALLHNFLNFLYVNVFSRGFSFVSKV